MSNLRAIEYEPFEAIKHITEDSFEFWNARELANLLEYVQWRNFEKILIRAKLACKNSGYEVVDHFAEVSKTIEMITLKYCHPSGEKKCVLYLFPFTISNPN